MKDHFIAWNIVVVMTVILCVVSCKEEKPFGITFTTTYVLRDTNAFEKSVEREHLKELNPGLAISAWFPQYLAAVNMAPQLDTLIRAYVLEHGMLPPSTTISNMYNDYFRDKSIGDTVFGKVVSKDRVAFDGPIKHYDDTIMHYDEQQHLVADSIPYKGHPEDTKYTTMVVPFKRGWIYRLYWIGENDLDERLQGDDVLLLEGVLKERRQ